MCGLIGGYIDNYNDNYECKIRKALDLLHNRGPDARDYKLHKLSKGKLFLGHTRLSIIDLSKNSNQPMYSDDKRYGLIFNGEIVNYIEIKSKLIQMGKVFKTFSDTEVLLRAWEEWGDETLNFLEGMFAFGIFDFTKKTLTLARDAFGIKPLYYEIDQKNFIFSSEIKSIQTLKPKKSELNWQKSYDYLVHGEYDFREETFYKNIKCLRPGHLIKIDLNNSSDINYKKWWKPNIKEQKISFLDAKNIIREKFLNNIKKNLRSDVNIGAALSGGIDSSSIVCAIRHLEPKIDIKTFSYVPRKSHVSEEYWIDIVNSHTKSKAHKFYFTNNELIEDFDDLILTQGEPFGSSSIYASYRLYKHAKENGVSVTLDGQGADEILGGYHGYPGYRIHGILENKKFIEAFKFLNSWSKFPDRNRIEGLKRLVASLSSQKLNAFLRNLNGMSNSPKWINKSFLDEVGIKQRFPDYNIFQPFLGRRMVAFMANSLTNRGLGSLLRHGDRNSMRFSVESRVPFLTTDFADFTLSLPENYLVSDKGETKFLFREAMRGIVPDAILDRNDKVGFATPEKELIFNMKKDIKEWLNVDLGLPFLNQDLILKECDLVFSGNKKFSWQIWRWINFFRWYQLTFL